MKNILNMKRSLILTLLFLFAAVGIRANIPSGTTIYLDVSQHKCCYATYMFRSNAYGVCKWMKPVPGYNGLYSFKLTKSINNTIRFAGTNKALTINNGDEINYNIDDFGPWTTTCPGASTPYCIVTDESGTCVWAAAPQASQDLSFSGAQLSLAYNCMKNKFVAEVYTLFEGGNPCAIQISSPLLGADKVVKKPASPFSFQISDEVALGETVNVTLRIYSDLACTSLIAEKTLTAVASSQECEQAHTLTACQGVKTILSASMAGDVYEWTSTDPAINGANTRSVEIPTANLGTYTYSVKTYQVNIVKENNLMAGGDFEQEGIGFSSEYKYVGKDVKADYGSHGQDIYTLTKNVANFWQDFAPIQPHGGKYYGFFDANSEGDAWIAETNSSSHNPQQDNPDLIIEQGKKYYFSYWAAFPNKEGTEYFSATPATLQFRIEYFDPVSGTTKMENLGEPYTLSNDDHEWHQQSVVWVAPVNSAQVKIAVHDTVTDWKGNDFCLDDIMFQTISYSETDVAFTDKFNVTVTDCALCEGVEAKEDLANVEICDDELPYTWKWQTAPIATAGTYDFVEKSVNGCDSVLHRLVLTTKNCAPEPCKIEVLRKWNDFLFVDNQDGQYTSFQWYKNETAIDGATAQYYKLPSQPAAADEFYVVVNGEEESCRTTFVEAKPSAEAYPADGARKAVATRRYDVSANFYLVVTTYDDGYVETEKYVR